MDDFLVFAVDDDPMALELIHGVLSPHFAVETFVSAAACRDRLDAQQPGMFLLDVRMPEEDGYQFCRTLKADGALGRIPVTFVSSQDTIEARLTAYDAGGEDFVIKPFRGEELLHKVRVAQQLAADAARIRQQLDDSETLSSLVLANMDEYAILVRFQRELLGCDDAESVAACALRMCRGYMLEGVVQVRSGLAVLTMSDRGKNLPLEDSVMAHVRTLERIFEFRSRSVYNYERITMMINDMPLDDADRCGRLRDHLCIAMESAEARLKAVEGEVATLRTESGIREVMSRIHQITMTLNQAHLRDMTASTDLLFRLEQNFSRACMHLGLTEDQEREFGIMVSDFSTELLELLDRSAESHVPLQQVNGELERLVGTPAEAEAHA